MEFLEALVRLAERDPISFATAIAFAVYWFSQRHSERDDKNVLAALTLTTTMVGFFQQMTTTLESVARRMDDNQKEQTKINAALEKADRDMTAVTVRRDQETANLIARLDQHQARLDVIAKEITIKTENGTLRHEVSKILLIAAEMGNDVKTLLNQEKTIKPETIEPGEGHEPSPEVSEETQTNG